MSEYTAITTDRICHQSASNRTVSTFKVNIKQAKVSKISIWHPQDNNAVTDHITPLLYMKSHIQIMQTAFQQIKQ
jgi:hypothetical protein